MSPTSLSPQTCIRTVGNLDFAGATPHSSSFAIGTEEIRLSCCFEFRWKMTRMRFWSRDLALRKGRWGCVLGGVRGGDWMVVGNEGGGVGIVLGRERQEGR